MPDDHSTSLKVSVGWIELEVISEVDVILTIRGYAPVLTVKKVRTGVAYFLYIGAKSLAQPLEVLRDRNQGRFRGIRIRIRKESKEPVSRYEVEELP